MRTGGLAYTAVMKEREVPKGGMLPFKVAIVILYLVFIYQIAMRPLTLGANMSIGVSITIVVLHLFECFYYRDLIQRAPGSRTKNTLGIFFFGIFHMADMKEALRKARRTTQPPSSLLGVR